MLPIFAIMVYGLIGFFIGAAIIFVLRFIIPQQQVKKIDQSNAIAFQKQIDSLKDCINNLYREEDQARAKESQAKIDAEKAIAAKQSLEKEIASIGENISLTYQLKESQAQQEFEENQEICLKQVQDKIDEMEKRYEKAEENCKKEYFSIISDCAADYNQELTKYEALQSELAKVQNTINAAIEVNKRAQLEQDKRNYYRLILSDDDISEIKEIRSVKLRNAEPLNKVIWKVYYENPTSDLIGRVIGKTTKTGIYKITNLENGMCYVGQAVDIASRWKQHIKRGIGAETPTKNKLYPAMLQQGVENFSFEIIEECSVKDLDTREDYWQDFFQAKTFGYSIK